MPKPRSKSVDLGKFWHNRDDWIRTVEASFNIVHPGDPRNDDGNCTACALVTARALVDGTNPYLAPRRFMRIEGGTEVGHFGRGDTTEVWSFVSLRTIPGCVYLIEDLDDHVFNVVRHYNGNIYLVDSNMQIYLKALSLRDFSTDDLSHLKPGKGGMRILLWGTLNNRWL